MIYTAWPEWRIVREIGEGSQGMVFMVVRQNAIQARCDYRAVKVMEMHRPQTEKSKGIDPLREEALMRRFSHHPNVVQLLDSAIVKDSATHRDYLLLMQELLLPLERYDGIDLFGLGNDICAALSTLHQNGIYHLDVKPGKIFIAPDGSFKLGDFGTARSEAELSHGFFCVGTRHYTAPELSTTDRKTLNPSEAVKADIFSLGMVLYEISIWEQYGREVHGPCEEPHERAEWFSAQRNRAGYYPATEKYIDDVIRKEIDEDPENRYHSADEMRNKLQSLNSCKGGIRLSPYRSQMRTAQETALSDLFDRFLQIDVRSVLVLSFENDLHSLMESYSDNDAKTKEMLRKGLDCHQYVGMPLGVQVAYFGHTPPESIIVNRKELRFRPGTGFIEIDFASIFKKSIPMDFDIKATYADGSQFQWFLTTRKPAKNRNWFKRPDWT